MVTLSFSHLSIIEDNGWKHHSHHLEVEQSVKWLERAGFKPGNRVEIESSGQGTLTLRFVGQSSLPAMKPAFEGSTVQNSNNRTETGQLNFI